MNNIDKANLSQRRVVEFLKDHNFILSEVKSPTTNGIDIVAIKDSKNISVEVKSVIRSSRSWKVRKPNIKSDYIAVVMPSGTIHFESMSDWLSLCSKDGSRSITKLVNLYELIDL